MNVEVNPASLAATANDYRRDIDGLRAISVLAVLFYHYGVWPFTGGFVGVDVFFVISGYLITSQLWNDLQLQRFSLPRFYERRFRRILPALLVVLLFSFVAGYFLLLPGDYESLGYQGAYAAFGLSNFFFLFSTGYFDQEADLLPLLHTWSLAVEEQFYLIWPLILWFSARRGAKSKLQVAIVLSAIIIVSLAASIRTVSQDPESAFYLIHTRAWELALGALLVFLPCISDRKFSEAANFVGILLIIYSVFTLTSEDPFPGLNAVYPCIGAALIVWPKAVSSSARILGVEPMRQIGLASYSLYLWHWPILVFFRHWNNGSMPTPIEAAFLMAVAIILSFISLRWVETPLRKVEVSRRSVLVTGLASMILFATPSYAVAASNGLANRISTQMLAMKVSASPITYGFGLTFSGIARA